MIGLGSNRLSVCRRGGMSVTQAGRGGMEWLAGYRDPSWASPYSAQATAALKAQFPTQWPTIRDYGFAHPEIVGYMNAYAPEDAKIAYSLVEGIGWRALLSNGAYIVLNMIPTSSMKYKVIGKRKGGSFAGVRNQTYGGIILGIRSMDFFPSSPSANTRWTFGDLPTTAVVEFDVVDKHCKLYVDGQLYAEKTFTNANGTTTYQMQVFEVCDGGNRYAPASGTDIEISHADVGNVSLIPFKLGDARTAAQCYPNKACAIGTCGMIDLLTGIFYPNANSSGSFTISETPANQTP